jgi:hypothetical protein
MKTYSKEDLKEILEKHEKWLRKEEGGECIDLSGADLSFVDLIAETLIAADPSDAVPSDATLRKVGQIAAMLIAADLRKAGLEGSIQGEA